MINIFDDDVYLPSGIKSAFLHDPELGVCVLFKNDAYKMWGHLGMPKSDFSIKRIEKLLTTGKYSDFETDFVIFDKNGEVCSSNCDSKITVGENGLMYLDDGRYVVVAIEDKNNPQYVGGANVKILNKKVMELIRKKVIKKPIAFGKLGFEDSLPQTSME